MENSQISDSDVLHVRRSREIAARLSVAARKLRFSTSTRSDLYAAVGLRPRPIDRIFKVAIVFATVFLLILPIIATTLYYGFIASDQYQSETRFTVRPSSPALGRDQVGNVVGMPAAEIYQDTQIVVNFINSREILDVLKQKINFYDTFGGPDIDRVARLPKDVTEEELLDYWDRMVSVSVTPTSGIITLKARAFTPENARTLAKYIVVAAESVVNKVNDRIWKDVTTTAQNNLDHAKIELQTARENLAQARNNNGVLSVEGSSDVVTNLISAAEGDLLNLQQRYQTQISMVSKNAPQMQVLQREITSKQKQVLELKQRLAGNEAQGRNLASVSQDLSQLELAQSLAEQQFAASVKSYEQIQFVSKQQLLYLDSFLPPQLPDDAQYPKRALWIFVTILASVSLWGVILGLLNIARAHLSH
ncbi:MAG TPA: capsule biosynthesis protein [Rhizobium sp.]|nr:capsule biosynthesis protein [Rhizobium sp.]